MYHNVGVRLGPGIFLFEDVTVARANGVRDR